MEVLFLLALFNKKRTSMYFLLKKSSRKYMEVLFLLNRANTLRL